MGNLLQVLKAPKGGKGVGIDFYLDFEGAVATEAEKAVWDQINEVQQRMTTTLTELDGYGGAGESIRLAISNAKDEAMQKAAWDAVCPLVSKLKTFYDFSSDVEASIPVLLEALCADPPVESLEKKQALAKQYAEMLNFVLKFDDLKMTNPAIQNDFSYYRRTLSRMKMQDPASDDAAVVSNEEANRMSLFYAYPTPMLKCVSEATTKFVTENKAIPPENITDCLAIMATVCRIMVEQPSYHERFKSVQETVFFCQRVMVSSVIVYDHVHAVGAFSKKSAIDIKGTVKVVKMHANPSQDNLLNALRFSTKHFGDEDTPKAVKAMLA